MAAAGRSRPDALSRSAAGYVAAVTVVAASAAAVALTGLATVDAGDVAAFGVLAALGAAAQLFVVPTGRNHGFHTAIVFAVAAALVAPAALVAFLGLAQHGLEGVRKRYPWYIQLFNVASGTLFGLAAWSAAHGVLALAPGEGDWRFAVAGVTAAATLVLVNRTLLAGALVLARGHTFRSSGLFALGSLAMDLALAGLGIVLALVWRTNPWLVPALVAPLLMAHRTFSLLAALRESEERFRAMFDSAPVGAVLLDLGGRIAACNASLTEMLGVRQAQLVGSDRTAFVHPDDAATDDEPFGELVTGERERYAAERRYIAADGRLVWADVAVALARSNDGKPRFAIATVQDTTERRQLEEQLRQAQKLEAIGRLAGGVAHDFNNMLTAITGYGHMALMSLDVEQPVDRAHLDEVVRAADRARALTSQLLAFSRKQVLQPRVLSLNDLVRQLDKLLGLVTGEEIRVVTAFQADLGLVRADPNQLEQAIVNLVVNARDAMPSGGDLRVETANVEVEGGADLPVGRYVCLAVTDTGHGMDAETQARMFEPFFTTKPAGEGTGLGLATVHGVISQSGGHLRVESAVGAGTSCRMYLPRILEEAPAAEPRGVASGPLTGSETILVVEDEDVVRALIRDTLTVNGYSVLEARDGQEALELCADRRDGIDAVVTDVVMPRLGGPELVRRLSERQPATRVLFVSGYTDGALSEDDELAGAPFLQKPFTPYGLAQKVREVLDGVAA